MKMKYLIASFVLLSLSCTQTKESESANVTANENAKIDYSDYVHIKHLNHRDSMSADELALFDLLEKTIMENTTVKDHKFEFNLSKESFINRGIPEKYYDLLMKNFEEINHYQETEQSVKLNLDSLWQENVKAYKERLAY